jgi:non-specific serine/threonine protein kinase
MILTQRTLPSPWPGACRSAAPIKTPIAAQFAALPDADRRSNRGSLHHDAVNPLATAPSRATQTTLARHLGTFELLALLGKSRRSMAWRVRDLRRTGTPHEPQLLLLPREQPADAVAARRWEDAVRRAARLEHPNLAQPREIGICERWPYLLYEIGGAQTLAERLRGPALAAQEAAMLCMQALRGLAFAHDGGVAHGDLQPFMLLRAEHQPLRIIGLELSAHKHEARGAVYTSIDALQLAALREAVPRDALSVGLMLHWMLAGRAPLDEPDIGAQLERLAPAGRDIVRLPWSTALPVPEALRAIANRASERQPRQRYRSARGMERALDGWLRSEGTAGGGPLALLMDRLQSAGALPTMPGGEARAARLAAMGLEHTSENWRRWCCRTWR